MMRPSPPKATKPLLDPKKDPSRRCMRVSEWPETDRRAWDRCLVAGDIFDAVGAGAGWAQITRSKNAKGYGRWLTWSMRNGLLGQDVMPESRVKRDSVADYLAELRATTSPNTAICRIQELYQVIGAMAPAGDWLWIRDIEQRLRKTATSIRNKRMRVVSSIDLFQCGLDMMMQAEMEPDLQPRYRASRFRDGLQISLLALRPVRRRNLAAIEIGRHLIAVKGGYHLCFEASETKPRTPLEASFPETLIEALERYLTHHRPFLLNRKGRWNKAPPSAALAKKALWISGDGSPMTEMAIYDRITKVTKARFGHAVNPHLFRDSAATTIAMENPEQVRIIRCVLGHASMRTSERHYIHAQSQEALRRHQNEVTTIRRG